MICVTSFLINMYIVGFGEAKKSFRRLNTSFLPSNWNLDKNFVVIYELGQVHVANKIIIIQGTPCNTRYPVGETFAVYNCNGTLPL